jgi:hypothetical protein
MEFPVVELIAQAIVNRIKRVSSRNGFQIDVSNVVRPTGRGFEWSPQHLQVVVVQSETERLGEADVESSTIIVAYRQTFRIELEVMPQEDENVPWDQVMNVLRADVEKAIAYDEGGMHWQYWGGLAKNSEMGSPQLEPSNDGSHLSVVLLLQVDYRVPENDPYTAA